MFGLEKHNDKNINHEEDNTNMHSKNNKDMMTTAVAVVGGDHHHHQKDPINRSHSSSKQRLPLQLSSSSSQVKATASTTTTTTSSSSSSSAFKKQVLEYYLHFQDQVRQLLNGQHAGGGGKNSRSFFNMQGRLQLRKRGQGGGWKINHRSISNALRIAFVIVGLLMFYSMIVSVATSTVVHSKALTMDQKNGGGGGGGQKDNFQLYEPVSCTRLLQGEKQVEVVQTADSTATTTTGNDQSSSKSSANETKIVTHKTIYGNFIDPNRGEVYMRETTTDPSFQISVHNKDYDRVRWRVYAGGTYYEKHLVQTFQSILSNITTTASSSTQTSQQQQQQPIRVIDVGGNIGFYTLLSASYNYPNLFVDSFEPHIVNTFRLCQSLVANQWPNEYERTAITSSTTTTTGSSQQSTITEKQQQQQPVIKTKVNLYPYAVGDRDENLILKENENNPGANELVQATDSTTTSSSNLKGDKNKNTKIIRVVSLDNIARERGWFKTTTSQSANTGTASSSLPTLLLPPRIIILKIDVEGYEGKVLEGSTALLRSGYVENIFMEISIRRHMYGKKYIKGLQSIIESGYILYGYGLTKGPTELYHDHHDNKDDVKNTIPWSAQGDIHELPKHLIDMCVNTKQKVMNLWWKKKSLL